MKTEIDSRQDFGLEIERQEHGGGSKAMGISLLEDRGGKGGDQLMGHNKRAECYAQCVLCPALSHRITMQRWEKRARDEADLQGGWGVRLRERE